MRNKKAQIAGQIFIYIMAVVVVGGITLIGYSAVKKVIVKGCEAEKITFKTNIEEMIQKYTSYGSVNKKTIKAPCDYETLCFVDASQIGLSLDANKCQNPIIRDSVKSGAQQNIFVISNKKTVAMGYSDLISLNSAQLTGCLCIEPRNKNLYITFSGQGSSTEISGG